ncbi:MAG: HNH nuclease family protein [Verrucomicrobia bacterium]|nr:MAG: HNH nuclease family protein [Verrucomicrobiota bacterium]
MPKPGRPLDAARRAQLLAELRRDVAARQQSYRERALKLFPHLCARCGREFVGPRLKELTVHHKDHNHENNPPDGSNWELLCVYCHDHEHEKMFLGRHTAAAGDEKTPPATFQPFAGLDDLFQRDGKK